MNSIWQLLYMYGKVFGIEAVRRAVTTPEKWIRDMCAKTGADPEAAIAERNEMVEEIIEFIESLLEQDFEDPDPV